MKKMNTTHVTLFCSIMAYDMKKGLYEMSSARKLNNPETQKCQNTMSLIFQLAFIFIKQKNEDIISLSYEKMVLWNTGSSLAKNDKRFPVLNDFESATCIASLMWFLEFYKGDHSV